MASQAEAASAVPLIRSDQVDTGSLAALLQYEGEMRRQGSVDELLYFIANESRNILPYDQMFILREAMVGEGFHLAAASSIALVDRNAPLIQAIETGLKQRKKAMDLAAVNVHAGDWSDDSAIADYPYHDWRWQPVIDRNGHIFAGLLFARAAPWRDVDAIRTARIAETAAHSWLALTGGKPVRKMPKLNKTRRRLLMAALVLGVLFPVRMTALAPVEVVAARPFIVSAPYAGVISRIEVPPNALVKEGQPVLTFEDIKVRNELQQAAEKVAVAKAKLERVTSASFADAEQARDIATLRAEYDLAKSDYAYARDVAGKSQINAPRSGMAIYSDRRDWEGRAVNTGDAILQIADPKAIAYRIDLPTKEQMRLEPGAEVKVWLDAQPLWALNGRVEQASYQARPTADGILAFAVTAKPEGDAPRIGSRGTAKLYGQWVPFAYSLLKRPIASLRQFFGI
jgi:Barrel-sandwich domain of CusB or HlyD membrane-fusion